jgi:hypothetical protein
MIEDGNVTAVISMVSVGEVMQGPLRRGFEQAAGKVQDYLLKSISPQRIRYPNFD